MKKIAVLGSTGSIGVNTLKVISKLPKSEFRITALAANSNIRLLNEQIRKFRPNLVCVNNSEKASQLKKLVGLKSVAITKGLDGLERIVKSKDVDLVVMAISGNASLLPLIKAIEAGKTIALASKEPLVSAGRIVMQKAKQHRAQIIPVDSEHSAIFQCLAGRENTELKKIYLTGSGGPFRTISKKEFNKFSPAKVIEHPKWKMGKKISVDSATLMNKGLEVIEAMHLFDVKAGQVEVLIHPEAIVHSMVELEDGAVMAQLALPDMRLPIQYALTFPRRMNGNLLNINFKHLNKLTFHPPNKSKFPCLDLAYEAAKTGGSMPAVLNAANEEAVAAFLKREIKFTDIPKLIEKVMRKHKLVRDPDLYDTLHADSWSRNEARTNI